MNHEISGNTGQMFTKFSGLVELCKCLINHAYILHILSNFIVFQLLGNFLAQFWEF